MRLLSLLCSFALLLLFALQPVSGVSAETLTPKTCKEYQFPVALSKGQAAKYKVVGTLCSRGNPSGKTIQVLVHGFTLSKEYWDLPYQPERYSYVDELTKGGYATLSIDRIGVGESSKPPALAINVESNAYVVYQVIQQLRAGNIEGYQFPKVMLVGHSLGSMISVTEAAEYGLVDGVVLTGFLHTFDAVNATYLIANSSPAQLDPKFKNANLPVGYLTMSKASRKIFYTPADTDPAIYDLDNQLKGTGTAGELATFETSILPTLSLNIHVPVFLVMGSKDRLFCDLLLSCSSSQAIINRERLFYSPQAELEAYAVKNAGHNINYQLNAQDFYHAVRAWSDKHIGNK